MYQEYVGCVLDSMILLFVEDKKIYGLVVLLLMQCWMLPLFAHYPEKRQDRLPTMYWLPKLHKTPYKARFIANSSSCTTTELSKLLTSCLTAVKNHVIRYCEKVYERSGKNLFWSIKNSGEVLNKLKSRGFRATSLSTYDFSTLYHFAP